MAIVNGRLLKRRDEPPTTEAEVSRIFSEAIAEWRKVLQLDEWRICVSFGSVDGGFAQCEAQPKYRIAHIKADAVEMLGEKFSPRIIESTALHELCHIITWPLTDELVNPAIPEKVVSYFDESATEWIAEALLRTKYGTDQNAYELWNKCATA